MLDIFNIQYLVIMRKCITFAKKKLRYGTE